MIESIRGKLTLKEPTLMVLDVGGIGFKLTIPVSTFDRLPGLGVEVEVLTYLHVREDILHLYGFFTHDERDMFRLLIGISKIGPKLAVGILSGATPDEFKRRIIAGDVGAMTTLPGIGQKTAKRIIVELKDKFVKTDDDVVFDVDEKVSAEFDEAVAALVSLGFTRREAFRKINDLKRSGELEGGVEKIIRLALSKT